jgi:hypothetical protein
MLCLTLVFLVSGSVWAADVQISPDETPAILASLNQESVTVLDDHAAMEIRGQEYKYVLVKTVLNAFDGGRGVRWTWNPLGFRYGAWGGPGWSRGNGETDVADAMDNLFMAHDLAYESSSDNAARLAADQGLLLGLDTLATVYNGYWGMIYDPAVAPQGLSTSTVRVSGISFIGNRFFFGWRPMPYTEYARREAMTGVGIIVAGRSLLSSIP